MTKQDEEHVLSIDIDVPVETVWAEITKTGRLQRALYNTVLESDLTPGSRLRYYSPDKKRVFIVGEVLAVEPPRLLKHTYRMTMHEDEPTVVTWELSQTPKGTRVTLTHAGWTAEHATKDKTLGGWNEILELLKSDLETGNVPFKTRVLYTVMGAMSFMLPKSTKVEEVERMGW